MFTPIQFKAIVIMPMIVGTLSSIASGFLLLMILRSELKLTVSPRRIFFGLCVYDVIFSFSAALSSIPIPKGEGIWGASGNVASCDFQGFLTYVGMIGSVLYSCNLSIYYFCTIRLSMSESRFAQKIEPYCHVLQNLYPIGSAIYLLHSGNFNSIGNMCFIGPSPFNCISDPAIDCVRGGYKKRPLAGIPQFGAFIIIGISMASIVHLVVTQKRSGDRWATGGKLGKHHSNFFLRPFRSSQSAGSFVPHEAMQNTSNQTANGIKRPKPSQLRSVSVMKEEDPLEFNLREMRVRTRRESLIRKVTDEELKVLGMSPPSQTIDADSTTARQIPSHSDPHPSDVQTMRNSSIAVVSQNMLKDQEGYLHITPTSLAGVSSKNMPKDQGEKVKCTTNSSRPSLTIDVSISDKSAVGDSFQRRLSSTISQNAPICNNSTRTKRGNSLEAIQRDVVTQALLFVLGFILCFVWSFISRVIEHKEKPVPFALFLVARFFNPLQGVFNILVYSGPFVSSVRRSHPEYSWWKAFYLTVLSGGDNNLSGQSKRSNTGKASRKVQDKIEQNNLNKMHSIRSERRLSLFNSAQYSSLSSCNNKSSQRLSNEQSVPHSDDNNDERKLMANDGTAAISADLENPFFRGDTGKNITTD